MGGTSMDEMWDAGFAGSSPPFLGRERPAVDEEGEGNRRNLPTPAYLKVHTASRHFLGNGKIRRFGCSLLFSGVARAVQVDCRRP